MPVAVIGLVISAIGAGLSYSSSVSAANTAETFSLLNAQSAAQESTQKGELQSAQATLQATQAQTAAESAANNAEAIRAQSESDAKIGQENIRRDRDEFQRQLAAATAESGGSGAIISTGSPLDMLMNAADMERQQEQGEGYAINAGRVAGYRAAAGEELGGRVQGMNSSLYNLESLSAIQAGRMGVAQARLGGLAGRAHASGMRSTALGNLVSSAGSAYSSYGTAYDRWKAKK